MLKKKDFHLSSRSLTEEIRLFYKKVSLKKLLMSQEKTYYIVISF